MDWRRPGDNPLSEPVRTAFNDVYMRHFGEMGKCVVLAETISKVMPDLSCAMLDLARRSAYLP